MKNAYLFLSNRFLPLGRGKARMGGSLVQVATHSTFPLQRRGGVIPKILSLALLLLALPAWSADATQPPASMGRLFFTPNERASLNTIRQNSKAPDKIIKAEDTAAIEADIKVEAAAKPAPVMVNGYVSRSDGKNTVWVNNHAATEKSVVGNISVGKLQTTNRQVQVSVSGNGKAISLKPGQIYDPASDTVYNHLKDVPLVEKTDEEEASVVDKIGDKLSTGVNELKKKVSAAVVDLIKPKSDIAQPGEK